MKKRLTYDYCARICSELKTRSEIAKNHQTVYRKVIQSGWSELLPDRARLGHTKDNCMASAAKCETRSEFSMLYQGMYKTSRKNGWIDEFFPGSGIAKPQVWSLLSAVKEAKKHGSSGDLMRSNRSAYNYLKNLGIVSRVFGNKNRNFWTRGVMRAHALLCEDRGDFHRKYRSAYSAMRRLNCKSYVLSGIPRGKSASDLFYMWELVTPTVSGVWKVGVTSSKLKLMQRAKDSARSMGVGVGIYFEVNIGEKESLKMERLILDSSERFFGISGDGSTELVFKSKCEVQSIFKNIGKFKLVDGE